MSVGTKALFVDLDGTIRRTKSGKVCPNHPDDQEVMEGRYDKLWEYKNKGYKIVAVTNQGGIGLGYMTHAQCKETLKDLDDKLGNVFDKMLYAIAAAVFAQLANTAIRLMMNIKESRTTRNKRGEE